MNIIFFTQGNSLDTFYEIFKRINKKVSIGKVGFYVANRTNYKSFIKNHRDFESKFTVLKEWEIYNEAAGKTPNLDNIKQYSLELGEINLWTPYITDRRLSFGKKYSFKQSYKPYFSYQDYLSTLDVALTKINDLFSSINPDVVCTIYTATFGDCLGHIFSKARNVRALDLRLSRLKNYVMFVDGINEPPEHIKTLYNNKKIVPNNDLIKKAKEYISKVKSENALYDGALEASVQSSESLTKTRMLDYLNKIRKLPNFIIASSKRYKDDPQQQNPLASLYYNYFFKKINNKKTLLLLKKHFVNQEFLDKNKYIFYPLHVEPELVLAQFARPYLNQIEVIRNIRYSTPLTKTILVKDHPLMFGKRPMSYYKKILQIPNVRLINPTIPSEKILNNCELLVIIRGAMGLEAAIKEIPVVCLGKTMFELLPRSMYRFCNSLYKLKDEISDLLINYKFDEEALVRYLSFVIEGSSPVNLITDLLNKKGRYREKADNYLFEEHPHLDILSNYLLKRINDPHPKFI